MTKIGIIGTINRDTIVYHDREKFLGWGGILYNLKILSDLASADTEICPVCNIGQDCYPDIMRQLKKLPHLNLDYIKKVPENNNHCFLTYSDAVNKTEILKGGVPLLKYDDIKPILDCDIILVNYISGHDIVLESLQEFSREFKGQIYIDIHSYTLGKRKDGRRFLRKPRYWPEIVNCGDFIQLNRMELAVLVGEQMSFKINNQLLLKHIDSYYQQLKTSKINYQSKILIVTDGTNGCYISNIRSREPAIKHLSLGRKPISGDTTGCGDCFSAGFIAEWLKSFSHEKAAMAGNRAAVTRIKKDQKFF